MAKPDEFNTPEKVPAQTIEAVAKSFYKQAREYGFNRDDYLRFVNVFLDLAYEKNNSYIPPPTSIKSDEDRDDGFRITGERIRIRTYQPDDFRILKEWVDDPDGRMFLLTRSSSEFQTLEQLVEAKNNVIGMVTADNRPIGALAYLNINKEHGVAELRKLIGDPITRGKGYAREASQVWIEYGVINLGLRKIFLSTLETNLANIMLNESLGFRVEGLLREECFIDGEYHDVLRMSLIIPR